MPQRAGPTLRPLPVVFNFLESSFTSSFSCVSPPNMHVHILPIADQSVQMISMHFEARRASLAVCACVCVAVSLL
jgi:hypothetical protein